MHVDASVCSPLTCRREMLAIATLDMKDSLSWANRRLALFGQVWKI